MKTKINILKEEDLVCDCCNKEPARIRVVIKNFYICIGDNCFDKFKDKQGLIILEGVKSDRLPKYYLQDKDIDKLIGDEQ